MYIFQEPDESLEHGNLLRMGTTNMDGSNNYLPFLFYLEISTDTLNTLN